MSIIQVKWGEQWGCDCDTPRGSYGPKGGIYCILFMTEVNTLMITQQSQMQNKIIILCCQVLNYFNAIYIIQVKDGEQFRYNFVKLRDRCGPKGGIPFNFFITEVNALMVVLAKNVDQLGKGCISTRWSYTPRRGVHLKNRIHDSG